MKIAIGCDDAAYNLKVELIKFLTSLGIECDDLVRVLVIQHCIRMLLRK
ncbi:hypothetical protein AAUPMC_17005, partial [Pasteurella multocida subsp. multocida str. Anand1_cattle]